MAVIPEEKKKPGASMSFWADPELLAAIREAAEEEGLSPSKICAYFAAAGLKVYLAEKRTKKK